MGRHHTLWDPALGRQIDVEFTPKEEKARDLDELANIKAGDLAGEKDSKRAALLARVNSDNATLQDVLALLRSA
jgi:hypothetical protein